MDFDVIAAEVAAAVGLAEGPAGVTDVLRVIARNEPVATREVARRCELPVPIAAAICNELRKRDVVSRERPARLTDAARQQLGGTLAAAGGRPPRRARTSGGTPPPAGPALADTGLAGTGLAPTGPAGTGLAGNGRDGQSADPNGRYGPDGVASSESGPLAGLCPHCEGHGIVVPAGLSPLAADLARVAAAEPAAKLELDQTHCTVGTKLRRVLRMHEAGALGGERIILIGDDDLVSVAIAAVAAREPAARPARLAVVDCDTDLLNHLASELERLDMPAELIEHDLREPLPESLAGAFSVACTDPPYTVAGAELFLSRAVAALRPGPGGHVFFSFGARRPDEIVATQRLMTSMGLAVRSLIPSFNEYEGAGILAGTSHLYHLRSTAGSAPSVAGSYAGALYSADSRAAVTRPYRCTECGTVHEVGPGARWPRIAVLKEAGCTNCGGTALRPLPLSAGARAGQQ